MKRQCWDTSTRSQEACSILQSHGPAHHLGIEIRDEEASGLVDGVRAPLLRLCDKQDVLPVPQVGDDLESLRELARAVPMQDLTHALVDLHRFWIQACWLQFLPEHTSIAPSNSMFDPEYVSFDLV